MKLFDLPEPAPIIRDTKERCKNCIHIYKHAYGKMKYCEIQKDTRTAYGHKKIKANDFGCGMFEKKRKINDEKNRNEDATTGR